MAFGIHGSDHVDFVGDSITAGVGWNEGDYPWMSNPGGLVAQIQDLLTPSPAQIPGSATGSVGSATGSVGQVVATTPAAAVTVTSAGAAGQTAVQAESTFLALMIARIPVGISSPVLVLEWGINDAFAISGATETLGDFTTAYTSILTQILAQWPAARIACLNAMVWNEHWSAGPLWGPGNGIDSEIASVNSSMATIAASKGATLIDNRAALLLREVTQNPTNLVGGIEAVQNGAMGAAVHPMLDCMTNVMAPAFLAACPVS